jgi:GNAT superfamily N-acetyltransferase
MAERIVRRATLDDVHWIVDLSARVQDYLTTLGSLQRIGPLPLESTQKSICAGNGYILERAKQRLGSALVDPLDESRFVGWGLSALPYPLWYLHALMLEPEKQGQGLGLSFLVGVKQLAIPLTGTIVLDCWAGNAKLRDFYQRAGFTLHGIFPESDFEVAVFFVSTAI